MMGTRYSIFSTCNKIMIIAVMLFSSFSSICAKNRMHTYFIGGFGFDVARNRDYLDIGTEWAFSKNLSAQISFNLGFGSSDEGYYFYGDDYFYYSPIHEHQNDNIFCYNDEMNYGMNLLSVFKQPLFVNMNCFFKTGLLLTSNLFTDRVMDRIARTHRSSRKFYLGFAAGIGLEFFINKSLCFESGGLIKQIVNNNPQELNDSIANNSFVVYTDIKFKIF